jgi:hypothetical protein
LANSIAVGLSRGRISWWQECGSEDADVLATSQKEGEEGKEERKRSGARYGL